MGGLPSVEEGGPALVEEDGLPQVEEGGRSESELAVVVGWQKGSDDCWHGLI